MTTNTHAPPEAQARLDTVSAQQPWLGPTTNEPDTEEAAFADMRALSLPTLQEHWINEEDAVYDKLCGFSQAVADTMGLAVPSQNH